MAGWTGADPTRWASLSERKLEAVLRNSVQELAKVASTTIPNGGRVPVKTGNLARSVVVSNTPPVTKDGPFTGSYSDGIADIKIGGTIYIGYQAKYSRRMNYGFVGTDSAGRYYGSSQAVITTGYSNRTGYGFAESAAAQWSAIVARQTAKLKG